jgi:hypothetical protein
LSAGASQLSDHFNQSGRLDRLGYLAIGAGPRGFGRIKWLECTHQQYYRQARQARVLLNRTAELISILSQQEHIGEHEIRHRVVEATLRRIAVGNGSNIDGFPRQSLDKNPFVAWAAVRKQNLLVQV